MAGKGGEIYKLYKERYKIEPTSYAFIPGKPPSDHPGDQARGVKDREKIRAPSRHQGLRRSHGK